ncbi:hypothetical protein HYDPIDRAFT_171271 [Hydnomerulius pinastri MD-312]|uniref:Uncharacterized protein n=1 Tax=Hydnomerulius pinastri MD-312 TaxID=994086 RepID=A0A0C9VYG1_9AGAM|nr:hypothetical protein HYDPIDRAFT_171271 [Hydnomerulius pinastri MD-312]
MRQSKRLQEASKGGTSHTRTTSPQPSPPAQRKANPQASKKQSTAQTASGSKAKVCPPPSLPSPPSPESEEDDNLEDSNQSTVGSMKVGPPRGVVPMKVGPPWGVTSTKVGPPRGSVPHALSGLQGSTKVPPLLPQRPPPGSSSRYVANPPTAASFPPPVKKSFVTTFGRSNVVKPPILQCQLEEGWDSLDTEEAQAHRALRSPPLPESTIGFLHHASIEASRHPSSHSNPAATISGAIAKDLSPPDEQQRLKAGLKAAIDPEIVQDTAAARVKAASRQFGALAEAYSNMNDLDIVGAVIYTGSDLAAHAGSSLFGRNDCVKTLVDNFHVDMHGIIDFLETSLKATKLSKQGLRSSVLQLFSGMEGERQVPAPDGKDASTLSRDVGLSLLGSVMCAELNKHLTEHNETLEVKIKDNNFPWKRWLFSKRLQEASKGGTSHTRTTSPQPSPPAQRKANPQASKKQSTAQTASGSKAKVCPPPSLPSPPSPESEEDDNLEDSNQSTVGSMKVGPPRGVVPMKVGPPWGVTSTKVGPPRGSVPHALSGLQGSTKVPPLLPQRPPPGSSSRYVANPPTAASFPPPVKKSFVTTFGRSNVVKPPILQCQLEEGWDSLDTEEAQAHRALRSPPLPESTIGFLHHASIEASRHPSSHSNPAATISGAIAKDLSPPDEQQRLKAGLKAAIDPEIVQDTAAARVKAASRQFGALAEAYSNMNDLDIVGAVIYTGSDLAAHAGSSLFGRNDCVKTLVDNFHVDMHGIIDFLETSLKATKLSKQGLRSSVLQLFSGMEGERQVPAPDGKDASTLSRDVGLSLLGSVMCAELNKHLTEHNETLEVKIKDNNFPWKRWLFVAWRHHIQLINWHPQAPSVGPALKIRKLQTLIIRATMEPYLVHSRNGNKDLPEINIVPWTAGEIAMLDDQPDDVIGKIPLVIDLNDVVKAQLADCDEWVTRKERKGSKKRKHPSTTALDTTVQKRPLPSDSDVDVAPTRGHHGKSRPALPPSDTEDEQPRRHLKKKGVPLSSDEEDEQPLHRLQKKGMLRTSGEEDEQPLRHPKKKTALPRSDEEDQQLIHHLKKRSALPPLDGEDDLPTCRLKKSRHQRDEDDFPRAHLDDEDDEAIVAPLMNARAHLGSRAAVRQPSRQPSLPPAPLPHMQPPPQAYGWPPYYMPPGYYPPPPPGPSPQVAGTSSASQSRVYPQGNIYHQSYPSPYYGPPYGYGPPPNVQEPTRSHSRRPPVMSVVTEEGSSGEEVAGSLPVHHSGPR